MEHGFLTRKIKPFDPAAATTVEDALAMLKTCGFQGRNLGVALDIATTMCTTPGCFKVLALSGAMVPAGMDLVVCRMIERGIVDAIVSTGANIIHSILNCFAPDHQSHYIGQPRMDDDALHAAHINRIYDVLLPESEYVRAEEGLLDILKAEFPVGTQHVVTPSKLLRVIGDRLEPKGFVAVAARKGVPIFCGATSDSELALDLAKYRAEDLMIVLDEIGDVITFSKLIESHSTYGNIIVGGGVPRNWAQQVFPYLDQVHGEVGESRFTGFNYSVRFHTATELDGGLSGCTVSEGKSWGKYATEANHVSVWGDSTINLPLLVTALIQRLAQLRA